MVVALGKGREGGHGGCGGVRNSSRRRGIDGELLVAVLMMAGLERLFRFLWLVLGRGIMGTLLSSRAYAVPGPPIAST